MYKHVACWPQQKGQGWTEVSPMQHLQPWKKQGLRILLEGRERGPPHVQREHCLLFARGLPSNVNEGSLASVINFKGQRTLSVLITVLIITNAETSADSLISLYFIFLNKCTYLFIVGCIGSPLLHAGFL